MADVSIKPENLQAPRAPHFSKEASSRIPYYVKGLALGVPIYFVAIHLWAWVLIAPHFYRRADFRQLYAGAYMMRTGLRHELYNFEAQKFVEDRMVSPEPVHLELPFVSPAYHALWLAPLTLLPYKAAYISFLVINLILLSTCLALLWSETRNLARIYEWLPFALLIGFYPISWAFIQGQDSILLMTMLVAAFISLGKGRSYIAGCVTALAVFKFQIVLPIVFLFLLWKRWRFLVSFGICGVGLAAVSIWLTGMHQAMDYENSLIAIASVRHSAGMAQHAVLWQMMANINGFVFGVFSHGLPTFWIKVGSALLSLVVVIFTAHLGWHLSDAGRLLLAMPCAVLVGYHTYMHDLSILSLPVIVLLDRYLLSEGQACNRSRWIARMAALMFVAPIVDSFFPQHTYLVALAVLGLLWAAANSSDTNSRLEACSAR